MNDVMKALRSQVLVIGPVPPAIGGIASFIEGTIGHAPGVLVNTPPVRGIAGKIGRFLRTGREIVSHRHSCRVVHLHSAVGWSFYEKGALALFGKSLGYRTILHMHGGRFTEFYSRSRAKSLIRVILEGVDRVVVLSDGWMRYFGTIAPRAKLTVIQNGVSVPAEPPLPSRGQNVSFLGALLDRKGVSEAIDAFALVSSRFPEATLEIAGPSEGAAEREYRDQAISSGVASRVHFLGSLDGPQISQLFARTAVFILPSWVEALPMALLEAMAHARPVIATSVGAIPEVVVDGVTGYLVPPKNVTELADRLSLLLDDRELRWMIGNNAWKDVNERFNVISTGQKLRLLYRDLGALEAWNVGDATWETKRCVESR
jgi:glycosyltransferase involved in cell wall biosynthesis